ncbi:haloacid dehalogenase type II [Rhodococcus sp. NPDC047139]|uniref:haloacid dehalogenase type II n=1 Tax=Rhodococcus sp. NPDC047139 TaxID=3155141 RepID=UPI0033C115E3
MSRYDAYIFDVQGTLTDFYTPVARAVETVLGEYVDPSAVGDFVRAWRQDYYERILELDQSVDHWYRVQDSYADGLGAVCEQFGIDVPPELRSEAAQAWQRLEAWPDVRPGLAKLRSRAVVATLSNTDMATMVNLFRNQQLEADAILTAELFGAFKPELFLYERTCRYLGVEPARAAMVASHPYDLRAAREAGLNTVFMYRPLESGRLEDAVDDTSGEFDHRIDDLRDIP